MRCACKDTYAKRRPSVRDSIPGRDRCATAIELAGRLTDVAPRAISGHYRGSGAAIVALLPRLTSRAVG